MTGDKNKIVVDKNWIILLILTDIFMLIITWITSPRGFWSVITSIILFSVIILIFGIWFEIRKEKQKIRMIQLFINNPEDKSESELLNIINETWHPTIKQISNKLREQSKTIVETKTDLINYKEFIEAWTHEIKTPISLATLVLDNRRDEMSDYVYDRMDYVRQTIVNDVDRILYYARLQADHMDYKFTKMDIKDSVIESLEDFRGIIEEKNIKIENELISFKITSDEKILKFILSQIISNAVKYTSQDKGIIKLKSYMTGEPESKIHLSIKDNGSGVPKQDLPFIFDKGFTGTHPNRQSATGIGLYLVKKYAEMLNIEVEVDPSSTKGNGFEIVLKFPVV
ncbi:sensor histidine kinase [Microaceticoccus formicicus]|uniref:sensor histidine kinase n=1 Tax=Microaceticoccus formicicus TaxID=3118105 RepID=UPI003CD01371|nr:HAMP domain-containing sensor histidine kinase [Peptoniphilaceae bacterium AMB_02]